MERENHFCSLFQTPRLLLLPVQSGGLVMGTSVSKVFILNRKVAIVCRHFVF